MPCQKDDSGGERLIVISLSLRLTYMNDRRSAGQREERLLVSNSPCSTSQDPEAPEIAEFLYRNIIMIADEVVSEAKF